MKLLPLGVLLTAMLLAGTGRAQIIDARVEQTGDQTTIYCSTDTGIEIERAYFTLYTSDGSMASVLRREMKIESDNVASFRLPDRRQHLDATCTLFLAAGERQTPRERFSLSMLFNE